MKTRTSSRATGAAGILSITALLGLLPAAVLAVPLTPSSGNLSVAGTPAGAGQFEIDPYTTHCTEAGA